MFTTPVNLRAWLSFRNTIGRKRLSLLRVENLVMFKPVGLLALLALVVALTLPCALTRAADDAASLQTRLDTYATPDGTGYFALRLLPAVEIPQAADREVVILFDTSASQAGAIRAKGLDALTALLAGLNRGDRVALLAADLDAVPLSEGFVAPQSDEMKQAIAALQSRAPLGATDMPAVLAAAAASFGKKTTAAKAIVYIGDGVSSANFLGVDQYRRLIDALVDDRIAVTSYAVGLRVDDALLASLANLTGGMLAIDTDSIDPKQVGGFLASAVRGSVLWPTAITWPKQFAEVYPERMPPLRSDRDTIVVGKGKLTGEQTITMTATAGGKPLSLDWTVAVGESNVDFAFLTGLVESARSDGGLRLATIGTRGLEEVRRILDSGTETLAKLSSQAVATGNWETAERLADEALRRDPNDPTAQSVKKLLTKPHSDENADEKTEKLEVRKFQSEQAAPPRKAAAIKYRKPADADAPDALLTAPTAVDNGQGRLLENVEQQRRLITAQVRAEVENELRESRSRMGNDPLAVEQSLKLMMERVVQVPELKAEVRAQLRSQLEAALREANRRARYQGHYRSAGASRARRRARSIADRRRAGPRPGTAQAVDGSL